MTLAALGTLNIEGSTPNNFKHNKTQLYITINKIYNIFKELSGISFDYLALLHSIYLFQYLLILIP